MKTNSVFCRLFLSLFLIIFLSACRPAAEVQVTETESREERIPDIVRINNCGGTADTEQTATRSFSTTIEGTITVKASYKVVEGSIAAKYGEGRTTSKSIKLVAPPGTNMEFSLIWTEQTWIGRITADGEAGDYTARMPVSVEQVDAKDLGCMDALRAAFVLDVRPACGDTYTVEAEKPFDLRYGTWYARGMEQATDNSNHLTVTLSIDGQVIPGIKQDVQPVNSSWPGASCGTVDFDEGFGTFYAARIGPLTEGEHSVQIVYSFDTQVTDGYADSDGNLKILGPGQLEPLDLIIIATK